MRFEPPDVIHLRPNGEISVADTLELIRFARELPRPAQGFFGLCDMSKAGRQDPAAAKLPESHEYMRAYRVQVFYNTTFAHRTLIGFFTRLGKWLAPNLPVAPVKIFNTEAEAQAWIAENRNTAPEAPRPT